MYIQNLVKHLSLFCIMLLVCIPISMSAGLTETEWIGDIKQEGDFLEGGYEQFAVSVKYYEPVVLVSSILEEQNVPVYAHLMAIPTIPGMGFPRIQSVSVREVGTNALAGGMTYYKPALYSWDNFGYLKVNIKRIETEKEMPDVIDANLTATIRYESDIVPGLIGGAEPKTFDLFDKTKINLEENKETIKLDYLMRNKEKYSISSDRGFLVLVGIDNKSANFELYDSEGRSISRNIRVEKNDESRAYNLVKGSARPEDFIRIRVDKIDLENKQVKTTLLVGTVKGTTDVNFKLHIPIEKRLIKEFSPNALAKQINSTDELIEGLDKHIEKLEKIVENWYKVCLGVTVLMVVTQFIKGIGEGIAERREIRRIEDAVSSASATKARLDEAEKKYSGESDEVLKLRGEYDKTKKGLEIIIEQQFSDLKGEALELKKQELYPEFFSVGKVSAKIEGGAYFYSEGKNLPADIFYKDGYLYQDLGKDQYKRLDNTIVYDNKNNPYYFNPASKSFVPYNFPTKEFNYVHNIDVRGEKGIAIPITDTIDLPTSLRADVNDLKKQHGEVYVVRYNDRIEIYSARGGEIDAGQKGDMNERDRPLITYFNKDRQYREFEVKYTRKISAAQGRGLTQINLGGKDLVLGASQKILVSEAYNCEEAMGKWQCKILFNVCDPVICPASRCTFGTGTQIVDDVVQSGFFGSILLCFPNIKQGIAVPVCLSGILASYKNIRSYLVQYNECLQDSLEKNRATGICEKLRSIYICEIIWKQVINLLKIKSGLIGAATSRLGGGREYTAGTKGAVANSRKAVNYFVKDYAKNIMAAWIGRSTEEAGTKICRAAIANKLPSFKEVIEEVQKANNPVQYTAHFEEHIYAEVAGMSRYAVYYHIYAGSTEQPINYVVYLRGEGRPVLQIGRGILQTEESADETIDKIGSSKYEEVCVVINGEANCGFGKLVSSDWLLQQGADWANKKMLGREISLAKDCVPTFDSYISASVRRQCAQGKPGENWIYVGVCGVEGGDLGKCWMEVNTRDESMKEQIYAEICGRDKICNRNQKCIGEKVRVISESEICCSNECVNKDFVLGLRQIVSSWTLPNAGHITGLKEKVFLLDSWFERIKDTGDVDNHDVMAAKGPDISILVREKGDEVYTYMALKFLLAADYENARKIINRVEKKVDYWSDVMLLILKAVKELDDKEEAKKFCKIFFEETPAKFKTVPVVSKFKSECEGVARDEKPPAGEPEAPFEADLLSPEEREMKIYREEALSIIDFKVGNIIKNYNNIKRFMVSKGFEVEESGKGPRELVFKFGTDLYYLRNIQPSAKYLMPEEMEFVVVLALDDFEEGFLPVYLSPEENKKLEDLYNELDSLISSNFPIITGAISMDALHYAMKVGTIIEKIGEGKFYTKDDGKYAYYDWKLVGESIDNEGIHILAKIRVYNDMLIMIGSHDRQYYNLANEEIEKIIRKKYQ